MAPSQLTRRIARGARALTKPILIAGVVAAMSLPGGALAQAPHDVATLATTVQRQHRPSASHPSITFTNPLGRSRGPGAGAGLL